MFSWTLRVVLPILSFVVLLAYPSSLRGQPRQIDIKSSAGSEAVDDGDDEDGKPKAHYGVQLALYTDLLRRLNLSAGDYGYIRDVHGREVRYDLHAPLGKRDPENTIWNRYLEARQAVDRALSAPNGTGVTTPAASTAARGRTRPESESIVVAAMINAVDRHRRVRGSLTYCVPLVGARRSSLGADEEPRHGNSSASPLSGGHGNKELLAGR